MIVKLRVTISKCNHKSCYYLCKCRINFLYMSALQPFLYTSRENVALWVKYQARDHAFMLAWIKAWSGGWGKAAMVLTNDRVVYSRGFLWRVLLQHTTPWGQFIHWPLTNQWTSKKILDQVSPSGKLPTYASPNSTLTLSSHLGQNILVRGGVGWKLPKHLNWSVSAFFAVLLFTRTAKYQVKGQSALKFRADEVMDN